MLRWVGQRQRSKAADHIPPFNLQDILWVLDSGIVNTFDQPIRRCKPKVVAIDTKTNKVVKRIDLSDVITPDSRIQYLLVDYDLNGNNYM